MRDRAVAAGDQHFARRQLVAALHHAAQEGDDVVDVEIRNGRQPAARR